MRKNIYRELGEANIGCTLKINRWLLSKVATICQKCGCSFKIDDESINYELDTIDGVVTAENEADYISAAQDLHREVGIDLA